MRRMRVYVGHSPGPPEGPLLLPAMQKGKVRPTSPLRARERPVGGHAVFWREYLYLFPFSRGP